MAAVALGSSWLGWPAQRIQAQMGMIICAETVFHAGLPLLFPLLIGGFMGALIGQRLAPKLPDRLLRRGFAALLVGSALLTAGESFRRHSGLANQAAQQAEDTDQQEQPRAEAQHEAKGYPGQDQ